MTPQERRKGKPSYVDFKITEADKPLIEKLKPEYRQILSLSGSMVALAKDLDIAQGTVKSRLHRARAALIALRPKPESTEQC